MASHSSLEGPNLSADAATPAASGAAFLVCLPSMPQDQLERTLANVAAVFPDKKVAVASPDLDQSPTESSISVHRLESLRGQSGWVLTAADYVIAAAEAERLGSQYVLLLGADAPNLLAATLRQLVEQLGSGIDLVLPEYTVGPHDALVNSALLYPVSRALLGSNVRFPLPIDAGMSRRMSDRMNALARKQKASSQIDALLWPAAEAAAAGFSIRQVEAGLIAPPAPEGLDFNALFTGVAGSLFNDIEAKASFWQRSRTIAPVLRSGSPQPVESSEAVDDEVAAMVESFRLAHSNLQEIWSLVLPPQSLLALKKLSLSGPAAFNIPSALWARIVYDFALAFHLRTLNRGHLLGALTPLYLAWVASALRETSGQSVTPAHRDEAAAAFEREKPYLVSRWRWPDRFNP